MTIPKGQWSIVAPFTLGEKGQPIQVLRTGEWQFTDFGKIKVTKEVLTEMVRNFKNNVRGQQLPINVEHMRELGALGHIADMYTSSDGESLWIVPEFNNYGKNMVIDKQAFMYASFEFFREWKNEETGQTYQHVPIGTAMTNYPRIKNMATISCSEPMLVSLGENESQDLLMDLLGEIMKGIRPNEKESTVTEEEKRLAEEAARAKLLVEEEAKKARKLAEKLAEKDEQARQFAEQSAQLAELKANAEQVAKELAETKRQLSIEQSAREMLEFSETIENAKRAGRLTPADAKRYTDGFGAMPKEVRAWIAKDVTERSPVVNLSEVGSGAEGTALRSATGEIDTKALGDRAKSIQMAEKIPYKDALRKARTELLGGK